MWKTCAVCVNRKSTAREWIKEQEYTAPHEIHTKKRASVAEDGNDGHQLMGSSATCVACRCFRCAFLLPVVITRP